MKNGTQRTITSFDSSFLKKAQPIYDEILKQFQAYAKAYHLDQANVDKLDLCAFAASVNCVIKTISTEIDSFRKECKADSSAHEIVSSYNSCSDAFFHRCKTEFKYRPAVVMWDRYQGEMRVIYIEHANKIPGIPTLEEKPCEGFIRYIPLFVPAPIPKPQAAPPPMAAVPPPQQPSVPTPTWKYVAWAIQAVVLFPFAAGYPIIAPLATFAVFSATASWVIAAKVFSVFTAGALLTALSGYGKS